MDDKFYIGILVSNQFGVLTRVSGMFSRRAFNIDSLTVGETELAEFSRMTIVARGDNNIKDQMIKQLGKLQDVKEIEVLDTLASVIRELLIIKIKVSQATKKTIADLVGQYQAKVADYSDSTISIEMTGETEQIDKLIKELEPFGIVEMCRTGAVGIDRGANTLKTGRERMEHEQAD